MRQQQVWQAADVNSIHLLGHSFGGASMVLVAQEQQQQQQHPIQSLTLLDCWAFALDDATLQQGCGALPTLSILSQAWLTNPETAQVQELLHHHHAHKQPQQQPVQSWYCPNSVHASFSDAALWFPGWVARTLKLRGPNETPRLATIGTVARACAQHMQLQETNAAAMSLTGLKEFAIPHDLVVSSSSSPVTVAAS